MTNTTPQTPARPAATKTLDTAGKRLADRLFGQDWLPIEPPLYEAARSIIIGTRPDSRTGVLGLEVHLHQLLRRSALHRTALGLELKDAAARAGINLEHLQGLRPEVIAELLLNPPLEPVQLDELLTRDTSWAHQSMSLTTIAKKLGIVLTRDETSWLSDAAIELLKAGERIDREDPGTWRTGSAKWTAVVAARIGVRETQSHDLSHRALGRALAGEPTDIDDPYSWRLGSQTWGHKMDAAHGPLTGIVEQPIGMIVVPHPNGQDAGWQTRPVFSVPMMRLLLQHGCRVDRYLQVATPSAQFGKVLARIDQDWLAGAHGDRRSSAFQRWVALGDKRTQSTPANNWVGIREAKTMQGGYVFIATATRKAMPVQRYGAGTAATHTNRQRVIGGWSAAQELGELVAAATEIPLPVVLSSEAAAELDGVTRIGRMKGLPGVLTVTSIDQGEVQTNTVQARRAAALIAQGKIAGDVRLSRDARMVMQMAIARPLSDDAVLLPPQQGTSAAMVSGSCVNASEVGTGKTVMTGRALARAAEKTTRFRALIAVPAGLVPQWVRQLTEGHYAIRQPLCGGMEVLVVDHTDTQLTRKLLSFHRQLEDRPGLVVCSHETVSLRHADLATVGWHKLAVDEAHHAANPQSELHVALMALRTSSVGDAWMLTGTPKGKTTGDLDVLVGLAFGDPEMVQGRLASKLAGDTLDENNAARLMAAYGPAIQRVRKADMGAYMPKIQPAKPYRIEPDADTKRLLDEIRQGGKASYARLRQMLEEVKALRDAGHVSGELYDAALVELKRAQSQVLSNIGVLYDASIDVETLRFSQAQMAQELAGSDELARACTAADGIPLLRAVVAEQIASASEDTPVVVAAQRVRCLRLLEGTLQERHNLPAAVLAGDSTKDELDRRVKAFERNEYKALLLSPVAQTGFDLQHAGAMCHLDLPWVPGPLTQRLGRIARPGSRHESLWQWMPYLVGGLIPHIVGILAPRAAESHNLLDGVSGIAGRDTAEGALLGGIAADVITDKEEAGQEKTAAKLAIAASTFA